MKRMLISALAVGALAVLPVPAASATTIDGSVTYSGQGLMADGEGGYDLETEICGTENGAEVDGPYLLWVFTATRSESATITGPWGANEPMEKSGSGTFKYVSDWYDLAPLIGHVTATASSESGNPQLVISHGCPPLDEEGAWCSPGFWRNAAPDAWALTGYTRDDSFNTAVPTYWFGTTFIANPTLGTVLTTPKTYSGSPVPGTSGYALNAFNATGAMLTDALPGFAFSWDAKQAGDAGDDTVCPIDHHGNFKKVDE